MYTRAVKGLYIDLEEIRRSPLRGKVNRRCKRNDLVTGDDLMRCNSIMECDDLRIMTWDDALTCNYIMTCDDLMNVVIS